VALVPSFADVEALARDARADSEAAEPRHVLRAGDATLADLRSTTHGRSIHRLFGTPTFIVDGCVIRRAQPLAVFGATIDALADVRR
jgi:hypothetical protein